MRQILTILLMLCSVCVYGQYVPFGANRSVDTSKTGGSIYVSGQAVIKSLATTDTTNKVVKINSYGQLFVGTVTGGGGSGTVTSITATSPLTGGTITTSGSIGITQASSINSGYVSPVDWNTFNNKQAALGFTPENVANKVTSFASPNNTTYPTTGAVNTLVNTTVADYMLKADSNINGGYATYFYTENTYQPIGDYQPQLSGNGFVKAAGAVITYDNTTYTPLSAVSVTPTPSTIVKRDADGNAYAINFISNGTSTAASGGTVNMTPASTLYQELTGGASGHTFKLPDATTLVSFVPYIFDNNSTGNMEVLTNAGTSVIAIEPGGKYTVQLKDNATSAGDWDFHPSLPINSQFDANGLDFTGHMFCSGAIQGSNYSGTSSGTNTGDQPTFTSIPVSGQTTVTANSTTTALEFVAGSGMAITTNNTTKQITFAATGGSGTVTSVTANALSPLFTASVSNPTTTPSISYTLSNAGAYTVLCNTTNASAAPVYSKIDLANMVYGITAVANGGTGTTAATSVNTTPITYGSNNTITVPISTGVTGLGTGVATWAATPSSANFASALTDETGGGVAVFNDKPTFKGTIQTVTAMGAQAIDGSLGNWFTRTLASSETFTQSNFSTNQCFIVEVKQGSGTSYTVTWFSGITWVTSGGAAPTQTTTSNGYTTYGFRCTGTNTFIGYLVATN